MKYTKVILSVFVGVNSAAVKSQNVGGTVVITDQKHNMCDMSTARGYQCADDEKEITRCSKSCSSGTTSEMHCQCYRKFGPVLVYDETNCQWKKDDVADCKPKPICSPITDKDWSCSTDSFDKGTMCTKDCTNSGGVALRQCECDDEECDWITKSAQDCFDAPVVAARSHNRVQYSGGEHLLLQHLLNSLRPSDELAFVVIEDGQMQPFGK